MPKNVVQYELLISCPGDVTAERQIILDAVKRFNELYSKTAGINIVPRHWTSSAYPESGGSPQRILNKQFIDECDAAVAIFWSRFGTPTDEYGSGTEEEIERMLNSGKQVFMYFSDVPVAPSAIDSEQYEAVKSFRERYSDKGVYFSYKTHDEFEEMFFTHLSMHFLSVQRLTELAAEKRPVLRVIGIDSENKPCDDAFIEVFHPNVDKDIAWYKSKMTKLISEISSKGVSPVEERKTGYRFDRLIYGERVKIGNDEKELIKLIASRLNVDISDDFFELGELTSSMGGNPLMGGTLKGSDVEKEKYYLIKELTETINECSQWIVFEQGFEGFKSIKLALINEGTSIDEDIEITIVFPQDAVRGVSEFSEFENHIKGFLVNECDLGAVFGIPASASYLDYDKSVKTLYANGLRNTSFQMPGYEPDYEDDYIAELDDVFKYEIYREDESCVLKLRMEYIKHNTTVAFPSVIFINEGKVINELPYVITSKYSPERMEGIIRVL